MTFDRYRQLRLASELALASVSIRVFTSNVVNTTVSHFVLCSLIKESDNLEELF